MGKRNRARRDGLGAEAAYTLGSILGRFGLFAIVLGYAAASVWSELEPSASRA